LGAHLSYEAADQKCPRSMIVGGDLTEVLYFPLSTVCSQDLGLIHESLFCGALGQELHASAHIYFLVASWVKF
jgi:hypothetical protein